MLFGGTYTTDREGSLLARRAFPGIGFQGKGNLRGELDYNFEAVRINGTLLKFNRVVGFVNLSPSRLVPSVSAEFDYGQQPDVSNVRVGTGGTVALFATVQPTAHLGLELRALQRWIDETVDGRSGRLFTARVGRLKATYVFTPRMLVRLIGQYIENRTDPSFYVNPVTAREGAFAGSALFSYKLNWQTVLFVGYGDNRVLEENGDLTRADRQFFFKVSYAFQR